MRTTYHDLLGKQVVTADGRHLGRVIDLVAARHGDALCVTALLLGQTGLARRIGVRHVFGVATPPRAVPWRQVARLGDAIHLRATTAELDAPTPAHDDAGSSA